MHDTIVLCAIFGPMDLYAVGDTVLFKGFKILSKMG